MNLQQSAPNRFSVIVVGGGPAGLSAAIRVRFVKGFEAMAMSVALVEGGKLGGLLNIPSQRTLTGPHLTADSESLLKGLIADVREFEIPVFSEWATQISIEEDGFSVRLQNGGVLFAQAIVLATGSRRLGQESSLFPETVAISYKGSRFWSEQIAALANSVRPGTIAIVTNREVFGYANALPSLSSDSVIVLTDLERPGSTPHLGQWVHVPNGSILQEGGSIRIRSNLYDSIDKSSLRSSTEPRNDIEVGGVFLDYLAYQIRPQMPEFRFSIPVEANGVPTLDSRLRAGTEGLFLAGDATCRYASVSTALADGLVAGMEAYRYVCQRYFGHPPSLFAYCAPESPGAAMVRELPVPGPKHRLRWLTTRPSEHPLFGMEGSLDELASHCHKSRETVIEWIEDAMRRKWVTLEPIARDQQEKGRNQ